MQNARRRTMCTAKRWSTRMGKREAKRETMGKAHGKTLIGDGWQIWPHRNVLCYGRQILCQAHQLYYLHICISLLSYSCGVLLLCDIIWWYWYGVGGRFCFVLCCVIVFFGWFFWHRVINSFELLQCNVSPMSYIVILAILLCYCRVVSCYLIAVSPVSIGGRLSYRLIPWCLM